MRPPPLGRGQYYCSTSHSLSFSYRSVFELLLDDRHLLLEHSKAPPSHHEQEQLQHPHSLCSVHTVQLSAVLHLCQMY